MLIITDNSIDTFDHMPYVYGVDNKVIFDKRIYNDLPRKTINTLDTASYSASISFDMKYGFNKDYYIENAKYDSWKYFNRKNDPHPKVKYSLYNFFYCGRVYLLAQKLVRNDTRMIVDHYDALDEYYFVADSIDGNPYYIEANQGILDYAKENNIPFFVYTIDSKKHNYIVIQPHINYVPLHKINLPFFDDVNRTYNDIYNYMLTYKNDNNIIQVSNEDKIKQAGFDLKTSFRNM